MSNIAILGAAWGDEGKGHITHKLSKDFDWVVRFSGGANAGHTIYRDGVKYVHNLLPSFDWRSDRPKAFLGSGMVIDLEQLLKEVSALAKIDPELPSRVYVDPDTFIVLPEHKEEDKALNGHIGSTNRGIGPAYKSKVSRSGTRIRDLEFRSDMLGWYVGALEVLGVKFKTVMELSNEMKREEILFEGAQGVLLDINHGIYPFVSCGDSTVAGIYAAGFAFAMPEIVYGVVKAYTTKVGEGPFPTELSGEEGEKLRKLGNEYGATTGRPRRVGWLDLPALDYACKKGGINRLIVTKFDILDGMDSVPICTAYDKTPVSSKDFFTAKPQYITAPGWKNAKDLSQLSEFISIIEKNVGLPVKYVSCGTGENHISTYGTFGKNFKLPQ